MSSHAGVEGWIGSSCEAVFRDVSGCVRQLPWLKAAASVRFEELAPVAAFPVVPGKRWAPGWWWSPTTGRHVVHGSAAMLAQLMLLDRDPRVVGLAGRPVRVVWRDEQGRVRSWAPQLFARYSDGTALLADCPAVVGGGGDRARLGARYVGAACAEVGWAYRRLEPPDRDLAANVRWLAGYRHPRNAGGPERIAAVETAFRVPRPLIEGVRAVGDPMAVWPAVFHALWSGRLSVPLDRPLHERVLTCLGSSAGVGCGEAS
ncbi:TnsA-like heteromeric transposase endonuclease subunit [Streptomyces sp. NPDC059985]|uniref:TnsA-like heteromeric transposase endonuclease subunit n=1 Tax=Streptomyces sp. NPDC059985 TaxID=3347025 RepID=UPI00368C5CC7